MSDFKVGDKVKIKGKNLRGFLGIRKKHIGVIECFMTDIARVVFDYCNISANIKIYSLVLVKNTPSNETFVSTADVVDSLAYVTGGTLNLSGFKDEATNGKFNITSGSIAEGFTAKKVDVQKSKYDAMGVAYPIKPTVKIMSPQQNAPQLSVSMDDMLKNFDYHHSKLMESRASVMLSEAENKIDSVITVPMSRGCLHLKINLPKEVD